MILAGYTKMTLHGVYFLGELACEPEFMQITPFFDFPDQERDTLLASLQLAFCDYMGWAYSSEGIGRSWAISFANDFVEPGFDLLSKDIQALNGRFYHLEARAGIECIWLDIQELGNPDRAPGHYVLWASSKAFGAWVAEEQALEAGPESQDNKATIAEGGL